MSFSRTATPPAPPPPPSDDIWEDDDAGAGTHFVFAPQDTRALPLWPLSRYLAIEVSAYARISRCHKLSPSIEPRRTSSHRHFRRRAASVGDRRVYVCSRSTRRAGTRQVCCRLQGGQQGGQRGKWQPSHHQFFPDTRALSARPQTHPTTPPPPTHRISTLTRTNSTRRTTTPPMFDRHDRLDTHA